jgi:hypothetical protein
MDRIQRARCALKPGQPGARAACAAIALGSALLAGSTGAAIAQPPPAPQEDRAWGGCTLDAEAVDALESRINASGDFDDTTGGPFKVSFVLVYALDNDNDGQPLDVGELDDDDDDDDDDEAPPFTGVILCTNAADDPGQVDIETTTETTVLPDVDILDIEQTFVLQYRVNGGPSDGKTEKRVCQTTDSNTDCFRIFPPSD